MELGQSKWKIILAIVFAVLIAVIITLAVILGSKSSNDQDKCLFTDSRPTIDDPTNLASDDFKALASFSGFIGKFKDGKEQYLPLKLIKVSTGGYTEAPVLVLWTNCARLVLSAVQDAQDKHFNVNSVEVSLERPAELVVGPNNATTSIESWRTCKVDSTIISFGQYEGYACEKSHQFTCSTSDESLAVFVIDSIKFELDGDPEKIKQGQYSKPLLYC